jgi:hypothetical protein
LLVKRSNPLVAVIDVSGHIAELNLGEAKADGPKPST